MADPIKKRIIGIKVPDASIGEYVKVSNLTAGGQFYGKIINSDRSVVITQSDDFSWENGDDIQAEMNGRLKGFLKTKIQDGGANITLAASADTTTPGVEL